MHPCLLIDEIIGGVARGLHGGKAGPDLLHLALTCRALLEPAMDVLWADTPWVLAKLLLCLPEDARRVTPHSKRCKRWAEIVLLRPLVQSDWTRLYYYAKRVTRVALSELRWKFNGTSIHVSLDTVGEVLQSCPWPAPFFPNLRNIIAFPIHEPYLPRLLRQDTTRVCVFHDSVAHREAHSTLDRLSVCAPRLETLVVQNDRFMTHATSDEVAAQAALLARCKTLRKLITSIPLTQAAFFSLGSLATLQQLHLSAAIRCDPPAETTSPEYIRFPALFNLQLVVPTEHAAYLLGACSFPRLTNLKLTVTVDKKQMAAPVEVVPDPSAYSMDRLAAALTSATELETLLIMMRHDGPNARRAPWRQLVHGAAFLPLAALPHVRHVTLWELAVYLTPAVLTALAQAWPRLESLVLERWAYDRYDVPYEFDTGICVDDLRPLAVHCPALAKLALPLAPAPHDAPLLELGMGTVVQRALEHLDISWSTIRSGPDCQRVARFLSAVFPNVECDGAWTVKSAIKTAMRELCMV